MVNRDGRTYSIPAESKDIGSISSFFKWEQAFRVFSNIYTAKYRQKAVELIQYNHLINMVSLTFTWENVYMYDKDFHMHISRHPYRSWSIILQQAWSVRLKDRIRNNNSNGNSSGGFARNNNGNGYGRSGRREFCWRFNNGKCTYGLSCKFAHKCSTCLHYEHGTHNCRKANSYDKVDHRDRFRHHDNVGRSGQKSDHSDRRDKRT